MTDTFTEAVDTIKRGFAPVIVFSFFINLLMLTAPLYMLQVYDRVLSSRNIDTLLVLTLIAITALVTLAALEGVRTYVMIGVSGWMSRRLGGPVLGSSVAGALDHAQDPSVRGLRDLETLRGFLTGSGVFAILDAPWVPVFLGVIFLIHPLLGWTATGGAVVLFSLALMNEITTREPLGAASAQSQKSLHKAESAVRNADMIAAMGLLPNLVKRWDEDNNKAIAFQSLASRRAGNITAIAKFSRFVIQLLILGLGAWLAVGQEITPGAMIASSIIMGRALAPVEQSIGAWKGLVAAREAYQRIKAMVGRGDHALNDAGIELPPPKGRLTVENLTFGVPGRVEPIIKGISFAIEPGEALGLIGPSAAGKTTLARLIVGSWAPTAGSVRLDGVEMTRWRDVDRQTYIGYLPQDVELLGGTVRDNIARMGEADDSYVISAAQLADVHEMILSLPNGYESEIGEAGGVLSGGQRQRVALARALFGTPTLLVLDEPNSSLDRVGEQALLDTIDEMRRRGVTIVVIAHRPSMLEHVDKILVLREGRIEMFGRRDEVMAKLMGPQAPAAPASPAVEGEADPDRLAARRALRAEADRRASEEAGE